MSALPAALPGLNVELRRFEAPQLVRSAAIGASYLAWRVFGAWAAGQLRQAMASGDPQTLHRVVTRLRARWAKIDRAPVAAMNQAMDGMTVRPVERDLAKLTWIEGPGRRDDAAVLYIPGGSFSVERSPRITALMAGLARRAGMPVLVCDYRLAPEHPCPAAIDDAVAAVRWLIAQRLAPGAIAIAAESAGAAVALAAAQRLAAQGVKLGALAFLSPWVDLTLQRPGRINPLTRVCAALYLAGRDPTDPVASPVFGAFAGLPPLAIHASRADPLFCDAALLSETAARAGLDVTLRVWPGGEHVFERFFNKDSERSVAELAAFLAARLSAPSIAA